jgi:hypothetical protein
VQSWVNSPNANFGWILIGDELAIQTAQRFDSRQNSILANRPKLAVDYTVIPEPQSPWIVSGVVGCSLLLNRNRRSVSLRSSQ